MSDIRTGDVLVDAVGVAHPPAKAARIVSLVPSLTELVCDLGLAERLVGRTTFCVHPRAVVRSIASVGGTKTVHLDRVRALAPTHVLVNIDETPRAVAEELRALGCRVIVTHPNTVRDNSALYRLIGGVFDRAHEAEALAARLDEALAVLDEAARTWPSRRVLYLIWKRPWMTVSRPTYIGDMLALARLNVVGGLGGERYPTVTLDEALLEQVDLVLFASEPFPFRDQHLSAFIAAHPRHAGKARRIDGEMMSWYGSRALQGVGYLRRFVAALSSDDAS